MEPLLRFGHYEVLPGEDGKAAELGRGGMGITYKAYDPSLRRTVAVKVINLENFSAGSARERFLREARAAARLMHPNIATVFQLGEEAGACFYAMEFVDGENLDAVIKREGALPCGSALRIARQAASALIASHAAGIVHRDIKPSNLMIVGHARGEMTVKVIDFGLARSVGPSNEADPMLLTTGFVGTIHFASPEQIEGGETDIRSDIYSLGATLWHALTGRTLFQGSTARVIFLQVHEPPPVHRLTAPAEVIELLKGMLAKEPGERPQTPAELLDWIERVERTVDPDFVCQLSGSESKTPISVGMHEVLRIRRTLPLEEILPLLARLAAAVEGVWTEEAGKLDFRLNAIRVEFARDNARTSAELMHDSICEWPGFSVSVSRLPSESPGAPATDDEQTVQETLPFNASKNCVPILARVAFELLGGDPKKLGSAAEGFIPLGSLTEHENEVLKTALGDLRAKAFVSAQEFCDALESGNREREEFRRRHASARAGPPFPAGHGVEVRAELGTPPDRLKRRRWRWIAAAGVLSALAAGAVFFVRDRKIEQAGGVLRSTPGSKLTSATAARAKKLLEASPVAPFINGLGMSFVVVPIAGASSSPTILFARTETTVSQYAAFLQAKGRTEIKPEFAQGDDHPVVNVTWEDAVAFCAWLTETEVAAGRLPAGVRYRLPTDHEWSSAAGIGDREDATKSPKEKRGGIADVYPWGAGWPPPARSGNYADVAARSAGSAQVVLENYDDGFAQTCPVGSFPANALGLYGLGGNASEWCEDWYDSEKRDNRTLRGACWRDSDEFYLRTSFRGSFDPRQSFAGYGFRCVLEVPAAK